jgi:dTDP-4-dehydrorhamnose reductase
VRKILVLGASGQLGNRIMSDIENCVGTYNSHNNFMAPNFFELNTSDFEQFKKLVEAVQPNVIINCIGLTNVDMCEKFPEKNWLINSKFPAEVASYCKVLNIKLVHISTDHFQTTDSTIISESSILTNPNQYSYSKLSAEEMIQDLNPDSIIVRTNFFQFNLESPKTFVDNMIREISKKRLVRSVGDIYFTPISIATLIKLIIDLIEIEYAGLINISSDQVISKYEFHKIILSSYSMDENFHKSISINDLNLAAQRPLFMALDNSKLKRICGASKLSIYDMIVEEKIYQQQRSFGVSR